MPRNMSFSLTMTQMKDSTPDIILKDVTRRWDSWLTLRPGDRVMAVEKAMGLPKGATVQKIRPLEVVSVRLEPLRCMVDDLAYGRREVVREGFPDMTPAAFVEMLCKHGGKTPDDEINRIEFKHLFKVYEQLEMMF